VFQRVPDLPWPRALYRDHTGLVAAQSLQQQSRLNADDKCICGDAHRHNVPWTRRSLYGPGWVVQYFCGQTCKSRAVREAANA